MAKRRYKAERGYNRRPRSPASRGLKGAKGWEKNGLRMSETSDKGLGAFDRVLDGTTEYLVQKVRRLFKPLVKSSKGRIRIPERPWTIVFLHIPRTAGDAMRTGLFNDAQWDHTPFQEAPAPLTEEELNQLAGHRMVKGFISQADLERWPRERRTFTFLRDPVERVLSLYFFLRHGEYTLGHKVSVTEFFEMDHPYVRSFSHNAMTWQLGDHLHRDHRTMTGEQALERAKKALEQLDFVGFFEQLPRDFPGLKRSIFSHARVPFIYPLLFQLGARLTVHRRRIRRHAARVTPEELAVVKRCNHLDIELYRYAARRFGLRAPIYDNYQDWLRHLLRS